MNVLVLQGSPNSHGSTAMLASEFARGAHEAGHSAEVVNVAALDIAPCTGCGCILGGGCGTPTMTARSGYPEAAFDLGRSL